MADRFGLGVRFSEADLFRLQGPQRTAAIDALTSGGVLPFVILGDEVLSTGPLDADVIAHGIERHVARG